MISQTVREGIIWPAYLYSSIATFKEHLCTAFQCFLVQRILHTAGFCILECCAKISSFGSVSWLTKEHFVCEDLFVWNYNTKWNFDAFEIKKKKTKKKTYRLSERQNKKQTGKRTCKDCGRYLITLSLKASWFDVKWLLNSYIPWQIIPSPVNPRLQVQFTEPSVLMQTAFPSHGLESGAHSLISEKTCAKKL